jgi:hypothetical protein
VSSGGLDGYGLKFERGVIRSTSYGAASPIAGGGSNAKVTSLDRSPGSRTSGVRGRGVLFFVDVDRLTCGSDQPPELAVDEA